MDLLERTIPVPETGCMLWEGFWHPRFQYGRVMLSPRAEQAHRAVWASVHGPIPKGMCVLHRCDTPPCCNPAHLFLGTHADNMRDMAKKGRGARQKNTHCPHGHLLSGANLYLNPRGARVCRSCTRAAGVAYSKRMKRRA